MAVQVDAVADERVFDSRWSGIPPTSVVAPRRQPGIIDRDDLVKRLLDARASLLTVTAPAGYGKSTTLQLWDQADDRDFSWVHLDAGDDDPVHLLHHVARALDTAAPIDDAVARLLTGAGRSVDTDLVPALGRAFATRAPFVIVLDDVHHLSSAGARRAVGGLLANLPTGSQLVLSGRSVPPIPTAKRRMSGDLVEITATELAMSSDEATRLLARQGAEIDDRGLERLIEQTEGWPGGLHLAALALTRPNSAPSALDFSGRDRVVADYLVEEVLDGLPEELVDFLCRSAVLSRMSAALLDELLETDTAGRRLAEIEETGNLFLVPLDHEREWYRYHHLFADMLRARLRERDPRRAAALERRASELLERHGDIDAAIRHAVAADDRERAADLLLVHGQRLAFHGRAGRVRQWLDLLGDDAVERIPAAAVACAWCGVADGDPVLVRRGLAGTAATADDGPMADGSPSAAVSAAMVRALIADGGLSGVLRETEVVRAAGDDGTNSLWGLATLVQGTAYSMLGEHEVARDRLTSALPVLRMPAYEAAALAHLALLDLGDGDLLGAERAVERALQLTDRHRLEAVLPTIGVFPIATLVAARRGRHDDAARTARVTQRLLARLGDFSARSAVLGYTLLAEAAVAGGDPALARAMLQEANRARRREPGATSLNARIDALERVLAEGSSEPALRAAPLTPAELRVLAYLPTHMSLQEIAEQLVISRNTAKSHSVAIYRKLGVSSRSDAVSEARRLGLLDA